MSLVQRPSPLPSIGEVFLDDRGPARSMRLSWHGEAGLVVLSLWHGDTCAGTFRMPLEEVPDLVAALRHGLSDAYDAAAAQRPGAARTGRRRRRGTGEDGTADLDSLFSAGSSRDLAG